MEIALHIERGTAYIFNAQNTSDANEGQAVQ